MIIIVDFGSQTTHLIGRRLQEIGAAFLITDPTSAMETIITQETKGVILSGGPTSVNDRDTPHIDPALFSSQIPILGICYGWQLMAHLLGGEVKRSKAEYGPQTLVYSHDLFELQKKSSSVIMSHGDTVISLPPAFSPFASTTQVPNAAVASNDKRLWGLQFHPEVEHTEEGIHILSHFALKTCGVKTAKIPLNPTTIIDFIKKKVGKSEVIAAVSGGVDSTVAAYLIAQAIGPKLHPIYIDNGLMRPNTWERVKQIFTHATIIDAEKQFLQALKGVEDPETKRKIIGKLYIELFEHHAQQLPHVEYLAQGTIYSDVIESSHIKTHHNVGGLPEKMSLNLLEPLRYLYKDQVRELGEIVGLPTAILHEHPFPGPGYAVRIRGEVTPKRLAQVKQADTIVMEEIEKAGLKEELFQCFALMTGAYSTAVKGDARAFAEVIALRAYTSSDVMTSHFAKLPYPLLQTISNRLVNEVPSISRVVYDITSKPPATMEWE